MPNPSERDAHFLSFMSVIIPVFNGEKTIIACLDSLASQKRLPDEIVVIDNGSTDQTVSLVKQWVLSHSNIPLHLTSESTPGPSAARNRGVELAKGERLLFLDADCIAAPDWLQRISDEMDAGTPAVGGPYQSHISMSSIEKYAAMSWFFGSSHTVLRLSHPFITRFLLGGNMAVFRRYWNEVKGFDETLRAGEDMDISFRLNKVAFPLKYIPHLAVSHQITSSVFKRIQRAFRHGMLQSKITKRDFRGFFIVSFSGAAYKCRLPLTIALELTSLTKIFLIILYIGAANPFWGMGLFLVGFLAWEFHMLYQLFQVRVTVTWKDSMTIPLGWAMTRLAMEMGRLFGSLRFRILCW